MSAVDEMESLIKEYEDMFNPKTHIVQRSIHFSIVNVQNNYVRCHMLRASLYEALEDEAQAIIHVNKATDILRMCHNFTRQATISRVSSLPRSNPLGRRNSLTSSLSNKEREEDQDSELL